MADLDAPRLRCGPDRTVPRGAPGLRLACAGLADTVRGRVAR